MKIALMILWAWTVIVGCGTTHDVEYRVVEASPVPVQTLPATNKADDLGRFGEFEGLVREFKLLVEPKLGHQIDTTLLQGIKWGDRPNSILGTCTIWMRTDKSIVKSWIELDSGFLQPLTDKPVYDAVVLHELAHCLLNAEHTENGLMQPTVPTNLTDDQFDERMDIFLNSLD